MKEIKSAEFNMDTGSVDAVFADGSKLSILCNRMEEGLNLSNLMQMEYDRLIYYSPESFVQLVMDGELMEYLHLFCREYREPEQSIQTQLEQNYLKEQAREIASEFMIYEN